MSTPLFRPLEQKIREAVLRVEYRDITTLEADALVSSDDTAFSMSGGVSLALFSAGGRQLLLEAREQLPAALGDIVVTTAGNLRAKKLFHAAVLDYSSPHLTNIILVREVTRKCLLRCEELGFQSIGFPALATGGAGLPPERSAVAMLLEIARHLEISTRIKSVTIALFPHRSYSHTILTRFYTQVSNILEFEHRLGNTTAALDQLWLIYRELGSSEAAKVRDSRARLTLHRDRWEEALSSMELTESGLAKRWLKPLKDVESELEGLLSLPSLQQVSNQHPLRRDWAEIERKYKEERRGALRALLAIHEKDFTELELQIAQAGPSAELERQKQWARVRIEQGRASLHQLDRELAGTVSRPEDEIGSPIPASKPIKGSRASTQNILHLSDLHFGTTDDAKTWHSQLTQDLTQELRCERLDALVLSGDIANQSTPDEYASAELFLQRLCSRFELTPERLIIVPGNHDLSWELSEDAYTPHRRKNYKGDPSTPSVIATQDYVEVRDEHKYTLRMKHFAAFYSAVKGEPYPLDHSLQGTLHHLPEKHLLFLGLNSAWEIDHHYRARASINTLAVTRALDLIDRNRTAYAGCLKIAVWHHPLNSGFDDRIRDHGFMELLAKAGFRIALHGHIHKAESGLYRYDHSLGGRKIDLIAAGTFGAPVREWVAGHPLQYNLLKLEGSDLIVETRRREGLNGAWKPDARWTQGPGRDPLPRYAIDVSNIF